MVIKYLTLGEKGLASVAANASQAFASSLLSGDVPKSEDAKQGLELLMLLARVDQEMGEYPPNGKENMEGFEAYCAVRNTFFMERVPYRAPGWHEWNNAIHQRLRVLLSELQRMAGRPKIALVEKCLDETAGPTPEDLDEAREFFARLCLRIKDLEHQ